ncbi:SRPBCC family protein [Pseudomonas ogarae]|uniref:SRPBCC family protein n=1 Tax=Pseudomonas ogarae (strain DSM 112162 / CECT 30235 / F113) TaxID=1114970 RepID=A0ABM6R1E5_PSEO1|nr:SRPBCC family protein [Pseudomonas ogarae]AEV63461.1 putative exported protein [Pseudomonas ogarae]AUO47312.1 SRPBCC family protein [Pseudomonas ogarae]
MTIVTVSKSVKLNAGASQVWEFIKDFGGFASWQPHIDSVEMLPNGDRKVLFKRGNTMLDRIKLLSDESKTLTYELVPGQETPPGAPPIKSLDATFVVTADNAGSEVTYTIEADVPPPMVELAPKGIGADVDGALEGLKTKFGS